jgi:hypothetical protein
MAAAVFIVGANVAPPALAAPATDACALLTQAQVTAAIGVPMGPGQSSGSSPSMCVWYEPGGSAAKPSAKRVLLDVFGQMGSLTPVDRFNNGKTPIKGIKKNPVSGVGDDAYSIVTPGIGPGLNVKKGNSAFQIRVYGSTPDQIEALEKTLAQAVAAKL